jgi:predicted Fe-Mo cluster-binding NifX family protein
MIVAVPLFGQDVAPRFSFADQFLIAEVGDQRSVVERLMVLTGSCPSRLMALSRQGVDVLLCSGFNRRFVPLATSVGIRVIYGLGGDARAMVEAFVGEQELTPS